MIQSTSMIKAAIFAAALACLGGSVPMNSPQSPDPGLLASFIPRTAGPWLSEADQVFDADSIFSYIDGAGEVYRSYNMKRLVARRFHKDGKPDLVVDAFDMGASADAFGVFTHDLDGEDAGIGQGSNYKAGLLSFWKDRYFLSVYAEEETPETKALVLDLGRAIAAAIPGQGRKPDLLDLLPPEGLDSRAVRYFHTYSVLNHHYFVANHDILQFDKADEAVLAPYGAKGDRSLLLIVAYDAEARAELAAGTFHEAYWPGRTGTAFRMKNGRWTALRVLAWYVAVVFEAGSAEEAQALLDAVQQLVVKPHGGAPRAVSGS